MKTYSICPACFEDEFGWHCATCDDWPCECPQEGDGGASEEKAPTVREEAVPVPEGGQSGAAPDAGDEAGVRGVPVREASETNLAPDQEAARVNAGHCAVCGQPGIQGQAFSAGREYYCPTCDDVHPYPWAPVVSAEPDPVECVIDELKRANASGAVVAQEGNLDELVENLLAEGWVPGETVYMHGRRIRYLTPPDGKGEGDATT